MAETATVEELKKAVDDLVKDETNNSSEIPGLNYISVRDNYIQINHKEQLEALEEEAREKLNIQLQEYYDNIMKNKFETAIYIIKMNFNSIVVGLKMIAEMTADAISSVLIPSVISTPPSTPNPAYTALENKQKKNNMLNLLKNIATMFLTLLQTMIEIAFPCPKFILDMLETLKTTKKAVDTVPA
ncbi:hypothetical protein [Coprobacter fastidiosus]|uniref:Uncharacterized protein n=1 Tax=Coprobacter fastidiosus NSB1 = JCM 33896 TaxID=1349822 RepID=A0A495VL17_9BACT|nr:hypothetical protein [Coprobacter fastidiosus]ERM88978.1 hypothetical protein NSB1T_12090 [Coprobacter fastidiosus NSB1 = JCM 33896]RKT49217.1 hypothetical protein BC742_2759 [Coprobacter fastidiosus NSB1 = JCM 33896]BEG61631.1 hypothetical protein Cfast33896_05860 [Coprobacter fastidiosus]